MTFKVSPNFEAPTDAGANNVYDIVVHANDGTLDTTRNVAITVTDLAPVAADDIVRTILTETRSMFLNGRSSAKRCRSGSKIHVDISGVSNDSSLDDFDDTARPGAMAS